MIADGYPACLHNAQIKEQTMNMSMYEATLPPFIRTLSNLGVIVEKAMAFAANKKIEGTVLANYRLAPDMLPLARQIQIATDTAKGCAARLAGVEPPKYEDNEQTLPELKERLHKTIDYLKTFKPEQIDGTEEKTIELKFPQKTFTFKGMPYVTGFVLPNFYFHVTTTYAILRNCGVEIGKNDYLGQM